MELEFKKTLCPCLDTVLQEVQNQEQTLELKLPEGMPDIGRILSAWGQGILRSKEWREGTITLSGGMSVWVLYAPEDGTQMRCIDSWIPFQMRWDIQEEVPEGMLRILPSTRFVDARSVSARKIMIRAGLSAMVQAVSPMEAEIYTPGEIPEGVELLRNTYPMRLTREGGEKSFSLDEELTLPASVPEAEKLVYYRMQPKITDQKIMGNKVVFRGSGNLHLLFVSEEGQLFAWDFELPFSQYAELEKSYSTEAQANILICPTAVELDLDEEGSLQLKCTLVGQYLVDDVQLTELTEDAYSPGREMNIQTRMLRLPALLESRQENIYGEQRIPEDAGIVTDVQFLTDFPRQRSGEDGVCLDLSGTVQMLYYGEEQQLKAASYRWEKQHILPADEESKIMAIPLGAWAETQPGSMDIKLEIPMAMTVTGKNEMPMITGGSLGEQRMPDPQRPSLILRRVTDAGLWEIAKSSDSTREAIRKANGLEADPVPGQMLLIPITG